MNKKVQLYESDSVMTKRVLLYEYDSVRLKGFSVINLVVCIGVAKRVLWYVSVSFYCDD